MSSQLPEQAVQATSFLPSSVDPVPPQDDIVSLNAALSNSPSEVDLVLSASTAKKHPLGRSWVFDWQLKRFVRGNSRSPVVVRGTETLQQWIAKALSTARNAHPASPRGYGIEGGPMSLIGGNIGQFVADPEKLVRDALTFHPRISDVTNFAIDFDPDDTWVHLSFTVVIDGGSAALSFPGLRVAL